MTSSSAHEYTLTSSPGKVLLAGGYLVLSPAYPGLVISTDSRFYSLVSSSSSSTASSSIPITIRSPQFEQAVWTIHFNLEAETLELDEASAKSPFAGKSPFLWTSLVYSIALALQIKGKDELRKRVEGGREIVIVADNDFYSQRKDSSPSSSAYLRSLPPFNHLGCPISKVHKTGLGSSAALTTSLVSSLLVHLGVASLSDSRGEEAEQLALVHNAAQLAHCAAQGKVGSGFDVSSAVWGSQVYRRFDPKALEGLLSDIPAVAVQGQGPPLNLSTLPDLVSALDPRHPLWQPSPLSAESTSSTSQGAHPTAFEGLHYTSAISEGSEATPLTTQIPQPAPLSLPPRIEMLLADVDAGSNTPSLVGQVLDWKKRKPEWSKQLYSVLATSNQSLADALLSLKLAYERDPEAYHKIMDEATEKRSKTWPAPSASDDPDSALTSLVSARNALRSIRAGMRELGKLSGAPIEPDEMGRLIQSTIDGVNGVVGGGVPGAGGYDALYLLWISPRGGDNNKVAKEKQLEEALTTSSEKGLSVGVLLSRSGEARQIKTNWEAKQGGLRLEDVTKVEGLQKFLAEK